MLRFVARGVIGLRMVIALVVILGVIAMGGRGVSAQDAQSDDEENTFTSPKYDYSLTWDESVWRLTGDISSDASDVIGLIATAPDYDRLIPEFNALLEGLRLPTLSDDTDASEPTDPDMRDYADSTGDFSLRYDANAWTLVPPAPGEAEGGILLLNQGPNSTGAALSVTSTSVYGTSVADCIAAAPKVANLTDDVQPRELPDDASIVEGLDVEGSEQTVFLNTWGAGNNATDESWVVVGCVPAADDTLLVIQLTAQEPQIDDAIARANEVIETIQIGG